MNSGCVLTAVSTGDMGKRHYWEIFFVFLLFSCLSGSVGHVHVWYTLLFISYMGCLFKVEKSFFNEDFVIA
jgi:hypothetical protein